jgi:hypothetical protein
MQSWSVATKRDSYIISCALIPGWSIGLPEMQAIVDINACRIISVVIACGEMMHVRVLKMVRMLVNEMNLNVLGSPTNCMSHWAHKLTVCVATGSTCHVCRN